MNNRKNRIALKPYLEMIEKDCSQLSRKELIDLILDLAKDEPTSGRMAFLRKLKAVLPGKSMGRAPGCDKDKLLEDIQALFDLMDEQDGLEYCLPEPDIELREERARYARCVYELSGNDQRLNAFARVMNLGASFRYDKKKNRQRLSPVPGYH